MPRRQPLPAAVLATEADGLVVQPVHQLLGGVLRQRVGERALRQHAVERAGGQRRHGTFAADEHLTSPLGLHRLEGQRQRPALVKREGAARPAPLGLGEHRVDRADQRLRRAVVGAEDVVAAFGGVAHLQVAVDVGTAEAVDRLLRVADQQQRGGQVVLGHAVQAVEQAVLQRRGVLELVDQRDRVLRQDALAQALAGLARVRRQGLVEPRLQIGETEAGAAALELVEPVGDAVGGVLQQARRQRLQRVERLLQCLELGELWGQRRQTTALLAGLDDAVRRQAGPAGIGR